MKRIAILLALAVAMSGCATIKGWFNDTKKENIQPPTPLPDHFKPTVQVEKLWSNSVGEGAGDSGARLRPTVVDGVLYADAVRHLFDLDDRDSSARQPRE